MIIDNKPIIFEKHFVNLPTINHKKMTAPTFLSGYVLIITVIVIIGIIVFGIGAVRMYSGKSKISKKNISLLFLYRLAQIYLVVQVIYLAVMLSVQLFSFQPYGAKKTGVTYGLIWLADGYPVPVRTDYNIPKKKVSIVANVDSAAYSFSYSNHFSWAFNIADKAIDSMQREEMPVIYGKNHAPYIRNDSVTNMIHVSYPMHRPRPTANQASSDTSVAVVPPKYAYTTAFLRSSSHWKNFVISLFTYINIFSRLVIAFFLLKILSSFRKEQLFTRKNFSYVNYIGITLMAYPVLNLALSFICNQWVIGTIFIDGISNIKYYQENMSLNMMITNDFSWPLFFMGFLIVMLAQVFRRGFTLDQDQKLTI